MLISVPDTPLGHALGQFMLLFEHYPLDLAHLHQAFADLSALAAREQPDRAWPLTIPQEDGPPFSITVEGLLAHKWAQHADYQLADEAAVEATLALWTGATVRSAQVRRLNQRGTMLKIELKTPAGQLHWLTVYCPWRVAPARAAPYQWNDTLIAVDQAVGKLRRAMVDRVWVQIDGVLHVTFTNGTQLVVGSAEWQPNAEVADLHYSLQTATRQFLRVGAQFRVSPLQQQEDDA